MLALAAVPLGLVMLQPDLGTAMVLRVHRASACCCSPARRPGGCSGWSLAGVLVVLGAVQLGVLEEYQLERFTAFTEPGRRTRSAPAYNVTQARIAIGNGGLTGTGLFKGTQTTGKFVPEQQTDFVFTVAGEELGLRRRRRRSSCCSGCCCGGRCGWPAGRPDLFGRLVAGGVACWFAFQAFVNIGMTLGIMPITGLPLPFVSYGGSAMFANWMADRACCSTCTRPYTLRAAGHRVATPRRACESSRLPAAGAAAAAGAEADPVRRRRAQRTVKDWDAADVRWA